MTTSTRLSTKARGHIHELLHTSQLTRLTLHQLVMTYEFLLCWQLWNNVQVSLSYYERQRTLRSGGPCEAAALPPRAPLPTNSDVTDPKSCSVA